MSDDLEQARAERDAALGRLSKAHETIAKLAEANAAMSAQVNEATRRVLVAERPIVTADPTRVRDPRPSAWGPPPRIEREAAITPPPEPDFTRADAPKSA